MTQQELDRILSQEGYSIDIPQAAQERPGRAQHGRWNQDTSPPTNARPSQSHAVRGQTENELQAAVFRLAQELEIVYPQLALLYAIPNGQVRPGQRVEPGLRPGMPDICLPVPRGRHAALYIELKVGANKPTATQRQMMELLREAGNKVVVFWDDEQVVIDELIAYIEGEQDVWKAD